MTKLHPALRKALRLAKRNERLGEKRRKLEAKLQAQIKKLRGQEKETYEQVNEALEKLRVLGIEWAFYDIQDYLYHNEGDIDGYIIELAEYQPDNVLAISA